MSISPSQIETWRLCKRKWAFTYIAGLPRPLETKAQKIGIALHAKAEIFISTGHIDYSNVTEEEAKAARLLPAILDYLPKGAQSEQKVKVTLDGVDFGGRFDWFDKYELGDLKSTSSLRYAPFCQKAGCLHTPQDDCEVAQHAKKPQPLIYAMAQTYISPNDVTCRWVYVQTRGAPHVREVKFKPDFSAMPGIVADAKDIVKAWADRGDPNSYEPNMGACESYGGCPFKTHCKLDSGQRLAMLMGLTAPKLEEPKAPTTKEPPDMTTSFDALMAAIQAPTAAPARTDAINPPPMQAVTRTEELPAVLEPAKAATVIPDGAPEAPTKRKRRTKAEMAAAKAPSTFAELGAQVFNGLKGEQASCDPQPKTDPAPAAPPDTAADPEAKPIGTLYIGCQPDHVCENGAYLFNAANWEVSEPAGLSDYRQAEYNKLQGYFVAAVVSKIKTIRPEHLFVDTRWAETNACLATLIAMSGKVVRSL